MIGTVLQVVDAGSLLLVTVDGGPPKALTADYVNPTTPVAGSQSGAPLSRYHTLLTPALSVTLPRTVNTALLMRWLAARFVTVTTGRFVSAKTTVKVRFDCIMNCTVALLVVVPPSQLVEITQLVNTKPLPGVAAML